MDVRKLLPYELAQTFPAPYSTEKVPEHEKVVVAKFFFAAGSGTWYAVEATAILRDGSEVPLNTLPKEHFDKGLVGIEDVLFFGYVTGLVEDEWGYFSLRELQSVKVLGLGIERDLWWKPGPVPELRDAR